MNFDVYEAKASAAARTFLVVSTSAGVDHGPPGPLSGFGAAPAIDALADQLAGAFAASAGEPVPVTLKIHGFNMGRRAFEREIIADAGPAQAGKPAEPAAAADPGGETLRPGGRFLIGYRWPSEGMLSSESLRDTALALLVSPTIGIVLLLVPFLRLLAAGSLEALIRPTWPWLAGLAHAAARLLLAAQAPAMAWIQAHAPAVGRGITLLLSPFDGPTAGAIWLGAGVCMLLLRLSTYMRDRYRALHYGVPDLGEFLRALEQRLHEREVRVRLDVVGHSMGTLLLVNAFRVMSDYFHGPKRGERGALVSGQPVAAEPANLLGRDGTFELGTLILCAPDIPAVMATPDHNNYFLSVLRRFDAVHVFSSDRDIILKWLSAIVNWASEPRYDMAGRKLGNVLLVRAKAPPLGLQDSRRGWSLWPVTRPILRAHQLYTKDPLTGSAPAEVHFHDCTLDPSLSGSATAMALASAVLVGVLAALSYFTASALFGWLATVFGITLALGLLARPLWPFVRDHGGVGGWIGALAEWPTLMMFVTSWRGWDPHGGYFMPGRPPRQRISALLRDPTLFPRRDARGETIEELDEAIRYRLVRVSV